MFQALSRWPRVWGSAQPAAQSHDRLLEGSAVPCALSHALGSSRWQTEERAGELGGNLWRLRMAPGGSLQLRYWPSLYCCLSWFEPQCPRLPNGHSETVHLGHCRGSVRPPAQGAQPSAWQVLWVLDSSSQPLGAGAFRSLRI